MKRILIIGCGLLGTSIALALVGRKTKYVLYGADIRPDYAALAMKTNAFRQVYDARKLPDTHFDVVILAVPVRAACNYIPQALELGSVVFDICSVKTSICDAARSSPHWERFAPTHPMAGSAVEGPAGADEKLFQGRPWLYIKDWPAVEQIMPIIMDTGAIPIGIESKEAHDETMAIVSHSIHLISLAAMTAYGRRVKDSNLLIDALSGPAFQDITRLAASPTGFWLETLMDNRGAVLAQLDKVSAVLDDFKSALVSKDEARLAHLLQEARDFHHEWRGGRDSWHLR